MIMFLCRRKLIRRFLLKSGAYVIRNVCNPEELCHLDSPVYFEGKQNVLCSGPQSHKKCAECFLINVLGRKKNEINEFELRQYSKNNTKTI